MWVVWIPIVLAACWDLVATWIGIAQVFEATTILTWVFSAVAALALSVYLYATVFMWTAPPIALRVVTITVWWVCFLFDVYTTLVGHLAVALDSSFRSAFDTNLRELMAMALNLSPYQLGIVVVTTLFVVGCTLAIGVRIAK